MRLTVITLISLFSAPAMAQQEPVPPPGNLPPPTVEELAENIGELSEEVGSLEKRVESLEDVFEYIPKPVPGDVIWLNPVDVSMQSTIWDNDPIDLPFRPFGNYWEKYDGTRHTRLIIRTEDRKRPLRCVAGSNRGEPACGGRLIYEPDTLPPGYNVTGVYLCYSLWGDDPRDKLGRLGITQFWPTLRNHVPVGYWDLPTRLPYPFLDGGGDNYTVYPIDKDAMTCIDTSIDGTYGAPGPGPGSCVIPSDGHITVTLDFELYSNQEILQIDAIGLTYDTTCKSPYDPT